MGSPHARVSGAVAALLVSSLSIAAGGRAFTAKDSVEMAEFTEGVEYSPDGRWFAVVTQRGNLQTNLLDAELRIGSSADARASLRLVARLSANINGGNDADDHGRVISRAFWSSDGQSVYFLGRDGAENRRLFVVGKVDSQP